MNKAVNKKVKLLIKTEKLFFMLKTKNYEQDIQ